MSLGKNIFWFLINYLRTKSKHVNCRPMEKNNCFQFILIIRVHTVLKPFIVTKKSKRLMCTYRCELVEFYRPIYIHNRFPSSRSLEFSRFTRPSADNNLCDEQHRASVLDVPRWRALHVLLDVQSRWRYFSNAFGIRVLNTWCHLYLKHVFV